MHDWAFITNHARVLLLIGEYPDLSVTEVAERAQITDRSTFRILADLQRAGYIRRTKVGRRNRYEINVEQAVRDPVIDGRPIGDLIALMRRAAEPPAEVVAAKFGQA